MTKNPFMVEENNLASEILKMNRKKITSACVYKKGNKRKTIGVIIFTIFLGSEINND